MKDIAFHITDIVQNSVVAHASKITVEIARHGDSITLTISDNGSGMDPETLKRATNPFYTTRTTRKVGLGLPFLIQNAQQCGGDATVESQVGVGTIVTATFVTSNIDCPPMGNLADTLSQIVTGNPDVDITVRLLDDNNDFEISSSDIIAILDGMPLGHPKVTMLIREMLSSNIHF